MSKTDTTEKGLETLIMRHMTGTDGLPSGAPFGVGVGVAEAAPAYGGTGWFAGNSAAYDREFAVDNEQQQIVDSIAVETTALNTAIARTEREIALMQEYRTRLTADLVTGKLDVREAAAKLPEMEAEPAAEEALEEIENADDMNEEV